MNAPTRRETPTLRRVETLAKGGAKPSAITPSQRAAVIIALLGEAAAKPIVEKLDDAALAKVVTALENISMLAREELVEIVIDFLTQLRSNAGALRGGRARAREMMSGIVDSSRFNLLYGDAPAETSAAATGDTWSRLRQREPKHIAEYLSRMPPNVIAIILRKLDPGMASNILCLLPDDKMSPTLGQMVEGNKVDPGIDVAIERMMEIEFLNNKEEDGPSADEYLETIGEVLSLIPDAKRDSLVSFLRAQHEAKLPIIQKGLFTIESLPEILPRNSVPVVFREIENDVMVKVLASLQPAYAAVSDYLLSNISSRMADQLRDSLKDAPAVSQEASETVQREFLTSVMDLKRRGLITIVRPDPKAE
ncbi:MAG: FliG C-terminal domain-containing protein [Hyphomonas sp.]